MKHYGDICKINGAEVEPVWIITGVSPCQDLSVAGKRAGLAGERSGLYMEQIRIVKEMRENDRRNGRTDKLIRPRFMVWENVPGALSSNGCKDFQAVLEEAAKIVDKDAVIPEPPKGKWTPAGCIVGDGWSIAWRIHDAQYFGVPQRRKRICMLCDFNGDTAGRLLFELFGKTDMFNSEQTVGHPGNKSESEISAVSESLPGDTEQSGKKGEGVTGSVEGSTDKSSYTLKIRGGIAVDSKGHAAGKGPLVQTELSGTLGVSQDQTLIQTGGCLNGWDVQSKHVQPEDGIAESLYSGECRGGGGESYVMQEQPVLLESNQNHATVQTDGVSTTLPASMGEGGGYVPMVVDKKAYGFEPGVAQRLNPETRFNEEKSPTLRANMGDNQAAVVYGISSYDSNAMKSNNPKSGIYEADTSRTLDNNGGNPACNQGGMIVIEGNGSRPSHQGSGYVESETMYTLNSTEHHVVCCKAEGVDAYNQAMTGEVSKPLSSAATDSDHVPVVLENHPNDSRVQISKDGKVQTLSGRMGTGGGNVPMVMEASSWDGSQIAPTLTQNNANGAQRMPDKDNFNAVITTSHGGFMLNADDSGIAHTLEATDHKDPQCIAYGLDRASYNQGQNAKFNFSIEKEKIGAETSRGPGAFLNVTEIKSVDCLNGRGTDVNGTLAADARKSLNSGNVCRVASIVRRLTPMECERLQGFPVVRKVKFTEMTKDEYIAYNINEGNIVVDIENGKVFATRGPGGKPLSEPKELIGSNVNGYLVVNIRNGETKMQCRIHRIVWIAEHGIIPDGYVVDHINNNKQDNRRSNLQLLTAAENSTKAKEDGLYKIHGDSGSAKISDEVHDFIQYVYGNTDLSMKQLSEVFGISKSRIHQIIHDEAWTDIGDWVDSKGKTHKGDSDSPRYKALGNSIALPFWKWLAERICDELHKNTDEELTMASLFDGIGGFPISFLRVGCVPVWASEIEEFPIAVTKKHFGEHGDYTLFLKKTIK